MLLHGDGMCEINYGICQWREGWKEKMLREESYAEGEMQGI